MSKTGAERQAAYRARRSLENSGERRMTAWISSDAYGALEELTLRYGVTKRALIETLLRNEFEDSDKPKNKKEFSSAAQARKKPLLSNESALVDSIDKQDGVGALRRNEGPVENPVMPEPAIVPVLQISADGQYQLEL